MAEFHLVEFNRKPFDPLVGFVLRWSKKLTLLHVVSDHLFELSHHCVLLNTDVRRWREVEPESILARALRVKKIRPRALPTLSIETWPDVLRSAASQYPLLVVHRERLKRRSYHVGSLSSIGVRSVVLKDIEPDASWGELCRYKFSDLTRVSFGGKYEDALYRVAQAESTKAKLANKRARKKSL